MAVTKSRLRVMLVDSSNARSAILAQALQDNGYEVVARLGMNEDLPARVKAVAPDVIIIELDAPDRDTLEAMRSITAENPKPIVMFADNADSELIDKAVRAGVSAYIVDGLAAHRLKPIMDVAIARFREYQALRNELDRAKTDLADRKIIDKAKGLLMQQRHCSEDEAYRLLRKTAMESNQRVVDVARQVMAVAKLLG